MVSGQGCRATVDFAKMPQRHHAIYRPTSSSFPCPRPGPIRRTRPFAACCAAEEPIFQTADDTPLLVRIGVGITTQILSLAGVGSGPAALDAMPRRLSTVAPGDVEGIMQCIRADYRQHAYFVTGDIHEGVYAEDCFFGDPTISFAGLQKWRRNLQLLVPFLSESQIELRKLERLEGGNAQSSTQLKAEWRLSTYLKLPWRPFIDILGETEYTLNPEDSRVVRHIESWSVSGIQAIRQIAKPSTGRERDAC